MKLNDIFVKFYLHIVNLYIHKMKTQRTKILKQLAIWTVAWTLSTALVTFGHSMLWGGNKNITILAIALNIAIGIGMILANRNYLNQGDELERKIQLEAMGLTLGLTLIMGIAYSMMDVTDIIAMDAEISFLVIFMGLTYITSVFVNTKKYR